MRTKHVYCVGFGGDILEDMVVKTVIVVLEQTFGTRLYLRITLLEMAFRNSLCKLPMSTDIDESEIILSHRQRLIRDL